MKIFESLTDDEITLGLEATARKALSDQYETGKYYAPGAIEFLALCRPKKLALHKELEYDLNSRFGLPRLRAQKDVANKNLEEIRAKLRGKT